MKNNERYNQIIDEAWNSYRQQTIFESNPKWLEPVSVMDMKTGEMSMGARQYHKNNFLAKCKTDSEFSEKWGLKIEERELSWEERDFPILRHSTKLITITYNNIKTEIYE